MLSINIFLRTQQPLQSTDVFREYKQYPSITNLKKQDVCEKEG